MTFIGVPGFELISTSRPPTGGGVFSALLCGLPLARESSLSELLNFNIGIASSPFPGGERETKQQLGI